MSLLSTGSSSDSGSSIEGIASDDVTEVWIELDHGGRIPAVPLMSLAPAGMSGQVFYVETTLGQAPARVIALGPDGEVLGELAID